MIGGEGPPEDPDPIEIGMAAGRQRLALNPNPTLSRTTVTFIGFNLNTPINLSLTTFNGLTVLSELKINPSATFQLNTTFLRAGEYTITGQNSLGEKATMKLIVIKN